MTKTEAKLKAQEAIVSAIASVGYSQLYEEVENELGRDAAMEIFQTQMNRAVKPFGYTEAWWH